MYEGANNEQYTTFCTPECASFIDAYLDYRTQDGEKLNPDSYMIRDQFDITDIEQIRNKSKGVSIHTFHRIVDNALLKVGLRTVDHTSRHNRKEIMKWRPFRKLLYKQVRKKFDDMMTILHLSTVAGTMACRPILSHVVLMSIIFEHYKKLSKLVSNTVVI